MIEKLDTVKDIDNIFDRNGLITTVPNGVAIINKINEIIDAVNKLQGLETKKTEPVDKFAEQRKWIGKLCKFRDNPACTWKYGILKEICEDVEFPFWDIDCYEYAECELVKPDDNAIYKGE